MEQEHRTKILSKIDRLVNYTKFDILVRACLYHKLLSEETVDNIQVRMNKKFDRFFFSSKLNNFYVLNVFAIDL